MVEKMNGKELVQNYSRLCPNFIYCLGIFSKNGYLLHKHSQNFKKNAICKTRKEKKHIYISLYQCILAVFQAKFAQKNVKHGATKFGN